MVQRKPPAPVKRMVWRISETAPLGEFVDPQIVAPKSTPSNLPETTESSGGWVVSSFELLHGADVTEGDDTVPADLFDELFTPSGPAAKASKPPSGA
jgi:hypothetical protein